MMVACGLSVCARQRASAAPGTSRPADSAVPALQVVGGIAEMFMCEPDRERILLKGRKGFCRCAIEGRADGLVPVYYL